MGQKINPIGFRLSVYKNWSAYWFADSRNFRKLLLEDIKVREYLTKKLAHASLGRIRIERPAKTARVTLYSARPGMIIGKKGEEIEVLRGALQKIAGVPVQVNIEEIRKPELDAQLIAASIAHQLERRIMFRRAMKRAMQNAMRLGGLGIKIMSTGRLNGAEIARTEWYREGRVPLHTLRAKIDYGFAEAKTTYGIIGIKVWVYMGENSEPGENPASAEIARNLEHQPHGLVEAESGEALPRTVRRRIQPPLQEQPQVEGESAASTTEVPRAMKKPAPKAGQRPPMPAKRAPGAPNRAPGAPNKSAARRPTDRPAKAEAGKPAAAKPAPAADKKPAGKFPAPVKPKKVE